MANATERVTELLREAILGGKRGPGEKLQPALLAAEVGASATVVREALTRLAGGGLVKVEPNRGFFVKELDLQELQDLTELRVRAESLGVELALARGDVDWEAEVVASHFRLTRVPRRSRDEPNRVSPEWQRLHKEFHLKILEASSCDAVIDLASDLFDSTEFYRCWAAQVVSPDARDVEGEHQKIVDAVVARDVEALSEALRLHYEATVGVILDAGLDSR